MNTSLTKIIVLLGVILTCIAIPTFSQGNQGHHQSGIKGRVTVEQVLIHTGWHVRITTVDGQWVADIETNDDGEFTINLKPGEYLLTAYRGGNLNPFSIGVTVAKKEFSEIQVPLILIAWP